MNMSKLNGRSIVAFTLVLFCMCLLSSLAQAHGVSEEDKMAMVSGGYSDYIILGAKHMVTGYDHLLFLFGVMFFLSKFGDIVKFVTAFTLGHSITLIGATYQGIQANYFLVDAVIALTVVYKGFDNLDGFRKYLQVNPPNLLWAVFVFGLIHGFGLSTRLQQIPLMDDGFLLRIISFNVGVEFGQIAALTVMLVVLSLWRHTASFMKFAGAANSGLIIAGSLLFLMQLHGYSHTEYPDEFGFPEDNHEHAHEDAMISAPDGTHVHEDGEVHLDHDESATDEAPAGQHVHDDGSTHDDHDADEQVSEGQHVHDDGSTHADHDEETAATEEAPEGQHVHDDGSTHADHDDEAAKAEEVPDDHHVHDDGSSHADHDADPAPGTSPVAATSEDDHDHPHEDDHDHPHDDDHDH